MLTMGVLAVCTSCEGPIVWNAKIKTFVEDGLSIIYLTDFSVKDCGEDNPLIPSRRETVVSLFLANPRSIRISGSVACADGSLFETPPVVSVTGPEEMTLACTPSLLAERRDLVFTVKVSAPELHRTYEPGTITLRCNTPPGGVESTLDAALDANGFAFAAFRLPDEDTDTDLSRLEVTYRPADGTETAETVELPIDDASLLSVITTSAGEDILGAAGPLNRYYRPEDIDSGEVYVFSVVVIDTEGLRSEPATITSDATRYSVMYDGNENTEGEVPVDTATYRHTKTVTVLGPGTLERPGWSFAGWNTEPGGTGDWFGAGDTFLMPSHDVVLYAQWSVCGIVGIGFSTPEYRAVLFIWNGDAVTSLSVTKSGEPLVLSFSDSGTSVSGWAWYLDGEDTGIHTGSYRLDIASPGRYTVSCSAVSGGVRYAGSLTVTVNEPLTVSYNGNGADSGSPPEAAEFVSGESVRVEGNTGTPPLSRSGYAWSGWSTDPTAAVPLYTGTGSETFVTGSSSVTLYAVWEDTPPPDVTGLSAAAGDGCVTLSWTPPAEADFAGVSIEYSGDGSGTVTVAKGSSRRTVSGLTDGVEYTFVVKAYDSAFNYSGGESVTGRPGEGP